MNINKAQTVIKYMKSNLQNEEKLIKCLKDVKLKLSKNQQNCHVLRKLGLTHIIITIIRNHSEDTQKLALSILTSCILDKDYQKEVHFSAIPLLVNTLENSDCKTIKNRVCRIIGQQCNYKPSCSKFHELNTAELVISFLKESETEEEKKSAIKTLRALANNSKHLEIILKKNGLYVICCHGLTSLNQAIVEESVKTTVQFSLWPSSFYCNQLMKGTDNFLLLSKICTTDESKYKKYVLHIFLTVFSLHSSCKNFQEYEASCKILDYLSMAKLPSLIVSELKDKDHSHLTIDESKLIVTLCKFCELNKNWKKFSYNVLPTYHERTWMQLTECEGVTLLVSLLSTQKCNLHILEALLRGLLGIEYLHSNKFQVLKFCFAAKLLPLLAEILEDALNECYSIASSNNSETCHHIVVKEDSNKTKSFCKEMTKDILNMFDCHSVQASADGTNPVDATVKYSKPKPLALYKKLNNIKFRVGNRVSKSKEDLEKIRHNMEIVEIEEKADIIKISGEKYPQNHKNVQEHEVEKVFNKNSFAWMNILEYIIRLLYQVISVKEDISSICKRFLLKFYSYIYTSYVVHPAALKLLAAVAKNSSSIQYVLDVSFIPKLVVDLSCKRLQNDCDQCSFIRGGVDVFLINLRSFFNHHHQYGRCEIANRLNPSKSDNIKQSCLVAFPHVVNCPKLLCNFLLDHKGLESLFILLNSSSSEKLDMRLYGLASICSISLNLKVEYYKKYRNNLFSDADLEVFAVCMKSEDKKEKKKQLSNLTKTIMESPDGNSNFCIVELEEEKNFTFVFDDNKTISIDKEKLSHKNEVLKRMFQGSFSESLQKTHVMKDINGCAMEMIIHFLYGCCCSVFVSEDINVYIDLIYLSRMYFLPELQILASHHISRLLDTETVYNFVESFPDCLDKDILQHIFCSLMGQSLPFLSKEKWINALMDSPFQDVFLQNVRSGLTRLLKFTSSLCSCDNYLSNM